MRDLKPNYTSNLNTTQFVFYVKISEFYVKMSDGAAA
jgi:hypothetical protein